ncbi:putative RNA-binding Zn-ribbon protein involved in translation (DUF1610 family) [Marmoricola sp. OAE513]|uniref:phage terminase large subunit family protein n=1 Tax=Marmoricola sp. OAE513 TaxID=2817894 RepID=UPI001AE90E3D
MSLTQRLVLRFAGNRAAEIERESRSWVVHCPSCGVRTSYWDLGGVRWKASSTGKKIRSTCPGCGRSGMVDVVREPAP